MKTKGLLIQMLITFVITLVTAIIVTLLWNLLIEKTGAIVDWKTSIILAIIMGIALPFTKSKNR